MDGWTVAWIGLALVSGLLAYHAARQGRVAQVFLGLVVVFMSLYLFVSHHFWLVEHPQNVGAERPHPVIPYMPKPPRIGN